MNRKSRFLIFLLVFAMAILPLFVTGCGDDEDNGKITEAEDDLPTSFGKTQKDYGGKKFTVLTQEDRNSDQAFNIVDLVPNNDLGDEAISVAVEARNTKIKKYFGVSIVRQKVAAGDLYSTANKSALNMDDQYTVMRLRLGSALKLALTGNLLDLGEQKWIDLDQPWWDTGITESLLLYGGSYFGTGDICTVDDDATWCVLFNKEVLKDQGKMDPSQLYQLVKDGDGKAGGWTISFLKNLAQTAAKEETNESKKIYDRNYSGDGKYGVTVQWAVADALMVSSNYVVLEPDKNNDQFKVKETGQSALNNAVNSIYEFMGGTNATSYWLFMADDIYGTTNDPYADNIRPMFMADRSCFFICHVGTIGLIREMETEFGMLPMPKLDDSVYDYGNTVQYDCSDCYVIHNTGSEKNAEFAAYILEALAYYSSSEYDERTGENSSLTYAYYETVLKRKNTRDAASLEMLDLIFENRIYDISIALDLKGITNGVIRAAVKDGNFSSKYSGVSNGTGIYTALGLELKEIIAKA